MSKELFNSDWSFMYQLVEGNKKVCPPEKITIPHDAVIQLERYKEQSNGTAKGFFPNVKLLYAKKFYVKKEWKGKYICLQFDGVYQNAKVLINGNYAGQCENGYERFFVEIHPYLHYGEENEVVVEASSGDDSRWYTGAGIYRNVYLIISEQLHFAYGGIKISTKSASEQIAVLESKLHLMNGGFLPETVETLIEIIDTDGQLIAADRRRISLHGQDQAELVSRIYVNNPQLWDIDAPNLYKCNMYLLKDERVMDEDSFQIGIRTISVDPVHGLCINGKKVKLYGGCVHHDHGIIGSAAFKAAEERKVRILKEAGYNALRFSHNPMSQELLDACDRYGLVVMDELTDVWNCSKTADDHSKTFSATWKRQVSSMVDKAYNHPSVIMYSVGNEINELSHLSGKKLGREIVAEFRRLDHTRFITSGINALASMMFAPTVSDQTKVNTQELNEMMTQMMDQISLIQCQDQMVDAMREFSECLDVVGYNYAEDKQLIDMGKYSNRICIGTETFPKSIAKNWKMMQEHPAIIGDFSWTAWDYLGETAIGKNGVTGEWTSGLYEGYPYKLANCGDIDIVGTRRPQSYYRECVVGKRKEPYISVVNPARYGQQIMITPWSWSDSISSWSWDGYEGKPIQVEVYGAGDWVELIVNGESKGRKKVPQVSKEKELAFCTVFDTVYSPGKIEAILYKMEQEVGRYEIISASKEICINVENQSKEIKDELNDLLYFEISLRDENGILKPNCDREIYVTVTGGGMLQGLGCASPIGTEGFHENKCTTYYGKALLAIRPVQTGEIQITVQSEGCKPMHKKINY